MSEAERFLKEHLEQRKYTSQSSQQRWTRPTNDCETDVPRTSSWENQQYVQRKEEPSVAPQRIASFSEAWMGFWTHWSCKGRASRAEYWWMTLLFVLPDTLVVTLRSYEDPSLFIDTPLGIILFIYIFATLIPSICLTVRRLHDANLSGGWWFLRFLPFIGWLILFIMLLLPSSPRANRYGPVPYTRPRT